MKKCDFCKASLPNGKCYWTLRQTREEDCKKAIKLMVEVLKVNKLKEK